MFLKNPLFFIELFISGVPASEMPAPPLTSARVLDKLIGHFIEPRCIQVPHSIIVC
jgi:hypothetical protein